MQCAESKLLSQRFTAKPLHLVAYLCTCGTLIRINRRTMLLGTSPKKKLRLARALQKYQLDIERAKLWGCSSF